MAKSKEKDKKGKPKDQRDRHNPSAEQEEAVETSVEELSKENSTAEADSDSSEPSESAIEFKTAEFQKLDPHATDELKEKKLELLMDLSLPVSIELGRTNLMIKDILNLQRGSIVEFEKLASEPVDILINGKKMAEGEVVVIEKHFGIRITNLINTAERIKSLGAA